MNNIRRIVLKTSVLVAVLAATAVTVTAGTASAQDVHGITVLKGCTSPVTIGEELNCSFAVTSDDNTGDSYTISSVSDLVRAADGNVSSGNILPTEIPSVVVSGGATCSTVTGDCTLPAGGGIEIDNYEFYTTVPDDYNLTNHTIDDQVTVLWTNNCDGPLPDCSTATQTNQSAAATLLVLSAPTIATHLSAPGTVRVGTTVRDTATLSGESTGATGTVRFYVYAADSCTSLVINLGSSALSDGSAVSRSWLPPHVGRYYFAAVYSGDVQNARAQSVCDSEPLVVTTLHPRLTTTLSSSTGYARAPVHDSALLVGASPTARGRVTYVVYADASCTDVVANAGSVAVRDGVVPNSRNVDFQGQGTYYFRAFYFGDSNDAATSSACGSEVFQIIPRGAPQAGIAISPNDPTPWAAWAIGVGALFSALALLFRRRLTKIGRA